MNQALIYLKAHPAMAAVIWMGLTGVVNLFTSNPAKIEAALEKNPRYAHFANFLRQWGFDPIAGLKSIGGFLSTFVKKNEPKE